MNRTFTLSALIFAALMIAPATFAHEGHGQAGLQALNGGVVKPGKEINMELVQEGPNLKLFPLTHDSKAATLDPKDMKVVAKIDKRGKNPPSRRELKIKPEGNGFVTTPDLQDVKHFKLEVKTTINGKSDTFEFPVEPQG